MADRADAEGGGEGGPVTVVVIAYNDSGRLGEAVSSALAQGETVGEVVVVDDASTDGTAEAADRLAAASPRVRVIHRAVNSGGCGTPRNDGVAAARGEWIAFLDSDDVLPSGAVRALLDAARRHDADVAAGLCVRLELPDRRERPWQPQLFTAEAVHDGLADHPRIVWDTLSVNKLYRREFLVGRAIRFPDGAAHYEDFVFTARVYAAAPRLVVIPDTVYVWHARPTAASLSISLRRDRIANWHDRLAAHRAAVEALSAASDARENSAGGQEALAVAARRKFAAYDVPMYLRDLHLRDAAYRREWWRSTREYVASFGTDCPLPADRWRTAVLLAREEVPGTAELVRLAELSAEPPRLAPPYAEHAGRPVWNEGAPELPLDTLPDDAPLAELPLCVSADVRARTRRVDFALTLHEFYGRVAAADPVEVEVALRHRASGSELTRTLPWSAAVAGAGRWRAHLPCEVSALAADGPAAASRPAMAAWDLWATVVFASGERVAVKVRAGGGTGRTVALGRLGRPLLLQAYATTDRSLALRIADGISGGRRVVSARWARVRRRRA